MIGGIVGRPRTEPMSEDQVPDSISFSNLSKLKSEKSGKIDFSNPRPSDSLGDLAFLVDLYLAKHVDQAQSHQRVFLVDLLITRLRVDYEKYVDYLTEQGAAQDVIKFHHSILATLGIGEILLDGLVAKLVKKLPSTMVAPKPSTQLIRSLDPSVRPHEVDEWLSNLSSLLN